jgi:cobyrinic acid a,c-diamide synthase
LADLAEDSLDVPGIFALAKPLAGQEGGGPGLLTPPGQRIAIARDAAFSFLYAHVLEGWRRAGSEMVFFSPLADEAPPPDCDSCWLPGGYPELHAGALAAARRFKAGLAEFAATRPVHGECGGYMVLGAILQSADGQWHAMTGLLSHETSFAKRRMNLGYRQATMLADSPLGPAGTCIRGHEFHYASVVSPGTDAPLAALRDAAGKPLPQAGGKRGLVSGAFFHAIARQEPAERG